MRVEKRKIAIILFLVIIINTIPDSFVSLIHLEKMYAADENYNNATCGNASCSNASCGNATCCDACKPYTLKIVDDYNIFGTGNEEIVYDNLDGNKMINEYIDELNLSYNHDYFEFENIWVDVNGNIISNMMLKNIADITSHCVCVYPRLKLKNNIAEIVLKDNKKCSNDEIRNISSTGWINDVVCVRLKCMNSNEAGQECTKLDGVDIEVNGKKEGNIFNFTEETEDSFKIKLVGSKSYLLSSEEFVLKIDNKKPVIEITSIDFPADEYKKQRTVTFSVSDSGSGIDENKVFVELPSGEDAVSTKNEKDLYSFVVEQNGDYIITVSDLAENIGEYKYIEERITSDGPIITDVKYSDNTEITEEYVGDNNNDRKVIFNVNKSGKGCEITDVSYITGEGENAALYTLGNHDGEYEIPFSQFNEGKNPLTINAADTSGNQTSCHVNIFKDTTSPDKPVITADKSGKIVKENITFTVTATDGNAGFNEGRRNPHA